MFSTQQLVILDINPTTIIFHSLQNGGTWEVLEAIGCSLTQSSRFEESVSGR